MDMILIGSHPGTSYTVTNGANTVTLNGLNFTPIIEQIAYVYNKTQDVLYYAPAKGIAKASISGNVITTDSSFDPFATGDELHIQMWSPPIALDVMLSALKIISQNPAYAHYTDPQHIDEDNEGAQNDTKYTRYAVNMASYKFLGGSYLITADDTHNDVTLKVYGTYKTDYALPDEDTAIADSDEIFNISEAVLGDAAGKTVNNASLGGLFSIASERQYEAIIFELMYEEDNTAAPANAADIRYKLFY
jgi:hypothetical protein